MQARWDAGSAYEPYVGRWSRRLAPRFLAWARVPRGARVLDVGCGTGALSEAALDEHDAVEVVGVDASDAFLATAATRLTGRPFRAMKGDAQDLRFDDAAFDAAVSGLVLNFLGDPLAAVSRMRRATRHGGVVAAYVWDYAGRMELMRHLWDAAVALDPTRAGPLDEGARFPLCQPEALDELFRGAGLRDVETSALDLPTPFQDFDDYWRPFLGGQGPAPTYVTSLTEAERKRLRETVRARLPIEKDGSIPLVARAFAVRGVR